MKCKSESTVNRILRRTRKPILCFQIPGPSSLFRYLVGDLFQLQKGTYSDDRPGISGKPTERYRYGSDVIWIVFSPWLFFRYYCLKTPPNAPKCFQRLPLCVAIWNGISNRIQKFVSPGRRFSPRADDNRRYSLIVRLEIPSISSVKRDLASPPTSNLR